MPELKKVSDRQLELSDDCEHCGARVKFVITSRSGEFAAEKVTLQGPTETDDDDKAFWEGEKK